MAVEYPLSGVVGIGLGEAVGVFFFGYLRPVAKIKGDFDQSGVGNFQGLVNTPHCFVIFGSRAEAPDGREVNMIVRDDCCHILVKTLFPIYVWK